MQVISVTDESDVVQVGNVEKEIGQVVADVKKERMEDEREEKRGKWIPLVAA